MTTSFARCPICRRVVTLDRNGTLRAHRDRRKNRCAGGGLYPTSR